MSANPVPRDIFEPFEISPGEVQCFETIGSGGFGVVLRGRCRGKDVAVKQMNAKVDTKTYQDFLAEVEMLNRVRHPNVMLFIGACTIDPGHLQIVTELMSTNLAKLLSGTRPLSDCDKLSLAIDAAEGLSWLHHLEPKIIHHDIKPENFLVDEHLCVKIADFGLSRFNKGCEGETEVVPCGTLLYMPPEVIKHDTFDESADIYSFGLVLWEILTRKDDAKNGCPRGVLFPFFAERYFPGMPRGDYKRLSTAFGQKIVDGLRPVIPSEFPIELANLLRSCWNSDRSVRPPCDKIVEVLKERRLNVAVPFPSAACFWKESFGGKRSVPWSQFCTEFCTLFGIDFKPEEDGRPIQGMPVVNDFEDLPPNVQALRCLHALLSSKPAFFQTALPDFDLTIERFGSVVKCLGGWTTDFLWKALSLCTLCFDEVRQKWFFGDLSAEEAVSLLRGKPVGTFLVRFSSNPGDFTISYVSSTGRIFHTRIIQHFTQDAKSRFEVNGRFFASIKELLFAFGLVRACLGSPYTSLVELNPSLAYTTDIIFKRAQNG